MPDHAGEYFLPEGVFMCVAGASLVFLDLRTDRYIGLTPELTLPLLARMPLNSDHQAVAVIRRLNQTSGKATAEECGAVVADLLRNGILTPDATKAGPHPPTAAPMPSRDLSGYDLGRKHHMGLRHLAQFLCACSIAFFKVRFRTTEQLVRSVRRRKQQQLQGSSANNCSHEKIKDLVEIFKILRPLFFTAKDHCLFDSLALIEFLARYKIYPTWVFGVHMGPFQAHCWVQDEKVIYNEDIDKAHFFTPIMTV
tara:strand:- start:2089 stop:2847 length:759 start_codon:yes stop_codon:yes gene_type:complete